MPHRLEEAPSGRAKCRGCKRKIDKGALRFSLAVPNPFGDGESYHHYHTGCAALRVPDAFLELAQAEASSAEADSGEGSSISPSAVAEFLPQAELSRDHRRLRRLVRAERASSGRARCRHCRETIDKGEVRLALEIVEDGMANPAGFLHVHCARAYLGTVEHVIDLIAPQTEDESIDLAEVETELLAGQSPSAGPPSADSPPSN